MNSLRTSWCLVLQDVGDVVVRLEGVLDGQVGFCGQQSSSALLALGSTQAVPRRDHQIAVVDVPGVVPKNNAQSSRGTGGSFQRSPGGRPMSPSCRGS